MASAMDIDKPQVETQHHHPLMSTFPVFVPHVPELFFDTPSFNEYISSLPVPVKKPSSSPSSVDSNKFMAALTSSAPTLPYNLTFTDKGAITHESTNSPLLDLFTELEKVISAERLDELLTAAWKESPADTLKIIWNARSIHVGKSDKYLWYRCVGWLREHHPLTLLANLEWVVRPVVEKKVEKKKEEEEEGEVVEMEDVKSEDDVTRFDVKNGGSHGYYCDLVNIVYLAARDKLRHDVDPRKELTTPKTQPKKREDMDITPRRRKGRDSKKPKEKKEEEVLSPSELEEREKRRQEANEKRLADRHTQKKIAKAQKHQKEKEHHENFIKKFTTDHFYRALHLRVARIFVEQIKADEQILKSGKNLSSISLASKWAPSLEKMHDRVTLMASTMAELLLTPEMVKMEGRPREEYLKHARQHYRQHLSALRKAIDVVEIKIAMQKFKEIHYNRVPSLAMDRYKTLFATKDLDRFEEYLNDVASGKSSISGAVLLPSSIIKQARDCHVSQTISGLDAKDNISKRDVDAYIKQRIAKLESRVVDEQWNTLVQRIKDSGTLENAIAVVDVSGSMLHPVFPDGTSPLHSSLGLGLLLANVAKPPFNNSFITFSENPQVITLDPTLPLGEKIQKMERADWGMTTNFNSVFENLILPMAINNKVPQEDMVKRIFVFSDMQFDQAQYNQYSHTTTSEISRFETNHERIKRLFEEAGYEMPEMVYWNLAGGRGGGGAPKPVTKETEGTAMVSGYSQGMLKVFLENGGFEEEEGEEEEFVEVDKHGEEKVVVKKKIDPLAVVKKAIGHKSYDMLKVVD
ncbi:hypothetical protein K440DRAFT_684927 [Wilcoxina mikolae CBS 423.85]|nr:hypothetical protein K440DRAFT_684927 [Wilcoxina mikolae CBS 423.85]